MKNYLLLLILFTISFAVNAQIKDLPNVKFGKTKKNNGKKNNNNNEIININGSNKKDSLVQNEIKIPTFPVNNYKIKYIDKDTITVDTSLTIRKFYKLNYIFKDDLSLLPFSNIGKGFTKLTFKNNNFTEIFPGFVAQAKTDNIWYKNEIPFFKVPTTYSNLFYLSGIEQGQILQAFITTNITPELNISIGYKGLNSLGLYKHSVSSLGRFFGSLNFKYNNRYFAKLFYAFHDIMNEENGGIADKNQFDNGGKIFKDRSRIDVNFNNAKNLYKSNQFFLKQSFRIFKNKGLFITNETYSQKKIYKFEQDSPSDLFGKVFNSEKIKDSVSLKQFDNFLGLKFKYKYIKIKTGFDYVYREYRLDSTKIINGKTIPRILINNDICWKSELKFKWKKITIKTKLSISPSKNLQGYVFSTNLKYNLDTITQFKGSFISSSKRPDYKFVLYQSAYKKLNWYNNNFNNVHYQGITAQIGRKKWGNLNFRQDLLTNYNYFGLDTIPHQYTKPLTISKLKYSNDFTYKKLGFSADLLFQKVLTGKKIIHLPSYILRGSIYFSDRYFKNNLFLQTGFSFKYFEGYFADAYHPVLGDFILQNQEKIGYYPIVDFFFNFKVKRFKFYFKAEHLNSLIEYKHPKYYTAPQYPYRDFKLRFGINWVFFN